MADAQTQALTELAWDQVAHGYDAYFASRFAPYLGAAIGALLARSSELPAGSIVVPCVGPGRELVALARAFPERAIEASDLSPEMVALARHRTASLGNVAVARADALELSVQSPGCAAILSVFGLQLLPDPGSALSSWISLLRPKGQAVIVYWLRDAETSGPFHSMRKLLREAGIPDGTWEAELGARAQAASGRILHDLPLAFEITHADATVAWAAFSCLGPLRRLALTRGDAFLAELGRRFVADLPNGPINHSPEARLLVIERS